MVLASLKSKPTLFIEYVMKKGPAKHHFAGFSFCTFASMPKSTPTTYDEHTPHKIMILGASTKPFRTSYLAIKRLRDRGYDVAAIGARKGQIGDVLISTGQPDIEGIHTLSIYINPVHQLDLVPYLIRLRPLRIIFNPGSENKPIYRQLEEAGIQVVEACMLVMLSSRQF